MAILNLAEPVTPANCFVRDDDVGDLTDELRGFVEMFATAGVPVSYQIIPGHFTEACARFLLEARSAFPNLIEFGQHGLHHRMNLGGRELKREFGPEFSLADQTRVVAEGLRRLRELLGAEPEIQVFTPPQHKFDGNTVRAAASAGHRIFSASCYPTVQHQLAYAIGRQLGMGNILHHGLSYNGRFRPEAPILEVSIALDIDDGKRRKFDANSVASSMRALGPRRTNLGLMFHHAVYADAMGRADLAAIVRRLADFSSERFLPLSSFAPKAVPAPAVAEQLRT